MENSGNEVIEIRKKEIISFLKQKKEWVTYVLLAFIVFIGVYIRTRNIPGLKDVTTGTWTLAPDLDPFLFLRWAEYIVEHGSIMANDTMRYVPNGFDTAFEMKLLSYMIAWFYHFLAFFNNEVTITYAAIWFPVVMFGLTTIAFFLFARKIFYNEKKEIQNIISLIATLIFVLVPSLLPRTIAGIPEKESAAFFFMFIAFYLFLEAMTSEKFSKKIIFGISSGIATGLMALIWGGFIYVFFAISAAIALSFILGKIKWDETIIYGSWLFTSFALMMPFSTRYTIDNLIASTSTGFGIGVFAIISMSLVLMKVEKIENLRKNTKVPKELFFALVSTAILIAIVIVVFGPNLLFGQVIEIKNSLIDPQPSRFGITVSENKQPFFVDDWKGNFGPTMREIPLFFWLFFIGSVALFNNMIEKMNKKERTILTASYLIFIGCLIFSKYSPSSILNGTTGFSIVVYFAGWLAFIGAFGYYYHHRHKKEEFAVFKEFNFSYILYFIILTLAIIGARAGIRLLMVLGAVSPIAISFLVVKSTRRYLDEKEDMSKFFWGAVALIIIVSALFTGWAYYKNDVATASGYYPSAYNLQWQQAMSWVRENTSEDAVFAHWWDYGYWVQSIGKRATILDGGNMIGYWNHLMGRLVLTGDDEQKALEFLYAHNGTHLLIDSTEIGKYTAFSSIGSDVNYDRISNIPTLSLDNQQIKKAGNSTIYVYPSGIAIDEDIILEKNGSEILLPRKVAGIGAIIITTDGNSLSQPEVILINNGKQYNEKLRFAYFDNNLIDYGSGIDAGVFIFPSLEVGANGQGQLNHFGAMLYLSPRVVHSQLAQLYLFDKKSEHFKLAHTESNLFVQQNLKNQGIPVGEFVYYQGLQGPIKIWEINYPSNIKFNEEYLNTDYPDEALDSVKPGEY
ncbi:MAG: STT3 domain-containing protein [Nanoarchaeota archaeon]